MYWLKSEVIGVAGMVVEWLGNVLGGRRSDQSGMDSYEVVETTLIKV